MPDQHQSRPEHLTEFLRVAAAYGRHNEYYFEALAGLRANWGDAEKMADAIWPWLRNWHSEFYTVNHVCFQRRIDGKKQREQIRLLGAVRLDRHQIAGLRRSTGTVVPG